MKIFKRYGITLLTGFLVAAWIAWSRDVFAQTELVDVFHILCDSFFVVGVVVTSFGLLIFSSNEGTFDMLLYGTKLFFGMFRKDATKKYDSFYDYRQEREKHKFSFGFLVLCGLIFLAISFVMYYFYCQYR